MNLPNDTRIHLLPGVVSSGLPEIKVPPFELEINNETLSFIDIIQYIGSSVIAIPLISILESVAVAKAFCKYLRCYYQRDNVCITIQSITLCSIYL